MISPRQKLAHLLDGDDLLIMPCCFDALSARLIEQSGFKLTFMSGFAVSACRIGAPDTGLLSYGEILDQGRNICENISIPVLGDADTGYGNALNIKRTINGFARAGFACAMIEDQVMPKRCGHTPGKKTVDRREALSRIQAAVDARQEGADILIMARTDARATDGIEEALYRCQAFADIGADIIFMEAPQSIDEMKTFCSRIPGQKMANMIQNGVTPLLVPDQLKEIGFKIAAYPLTLLSASIQAMQNSLDLLKKGRYPEHISFPELQKTIGFDEYHREEQRYSLSSKQDLSP
ncbi:MAG: isocitrate lyase/PEP mutase family protein [Desulfobulbaceae bacterium]|uniref:Isocitrate lyase/PEP mutase family protein n=1 Tax=Candidatus Desulfobia pelagia TaxID=2841692 RepID=A0A8J6NDC5_9BACT|nr:isocitrate lyase/PEP mutase family protein [Candidatus Desulfobia pelagia]